MHKRAANRVSILLSARGKPLQLEDVEVVAGSGACLSTKSDSAVKSRTQRSNQRVRVEFCANL